MKTERKREGMGKENVKSVRKTERKTNGEKRRIALEKGKERKILRERRRGKTKRERRDRKRRKERQTLTATV